MDVFAIVVTYNGLKWCDRCLGSLHESNYPVKIVVIDNNSGDGTKEYIKKQFPDTHLIESNTNLGFAKANNLGLRYAIDNGQGNSFFFLLNQDAWVEGNTIDSLLQTFEDNEKVGIASPIHLNGEYSGLDWGFADYMEKDFVSDAYMCALKQYYRVPFVNAAAWMISMDCVKKVGGFDTSLFYHYGEDSNYCQRVLFHEFSIVINTSCTICHDRESRKFNNWKYQDKMIRMNPFFEEKVQLGNINRRIDIDDMIRDRRIKWIKSYVRCSPSRIKMNKEMIDNLELIRMSRKQNIEGGLVWL